MLIKSILSHQDVTLKNSDDNNGIDNSNVCSNFSYHWPNRSSISLEIAHD